jgi:hypothetical protein
MYVVFLVLSGWIKWGLDNFEEELRVSGSPNPLKLEVHPIIFKN